jgi:glucokinase
MAQGESVFMKEQFALGIDIGGTKIAYALLNKEGDVVDSTCDRFNPNKSSSETLSEIISQVEMLTTQNDALLAGIGVGCPGQVDVKSGMVKNAVNLGWRDLNLKEEIQSRLSAKTPVYIRKDADANLLGEFYYGAAKGFSDIVFICIGSGLGCSIISNGRLVAGATGTAGGIGHIHLEGNKEKCPCGLIGCAETLISGPGLVNRMKNYFYSQANDINPRLLDNLTPAHVVAAASTGDQTARLALSDFSEGLGHVIAICISLLNPEVIVIGGGLGQSAFAEIMPAVTTTMKRHALPHTYQNLKILPASQQSSAVGAASLVWKSNIDP